MKLKTKQNLHMAAFLSAIAVFVLLFTGFAMSAETIGKGSYIELDIDSETEIQKVEVIMVRELTIKERVEDIEKRLEVLENAEYKCPEDHGCFSCNAEYIVECNN